MGAKAIVQGITAYTQITADGQKLTALILKYSESINPQSLSKDSFWVEKRRVLDAYAAILPAKGRPAAGKYVVVELDEADEEALTTEPIPGTNLGRLKDRPVCLRQVRDILTVDEETVPPWPEEKFTDEVVNETADSFAAMEFTDPESGLSLPYRLFIPYVPEGKKAGLILFFHGGSEKGTDNYMHLLRTQGAAVWGRDEYQDDVPLYVVAPQFPSDEDWIDPDTYEEGRCFGVVYRLVLHLIEKYGLDTARLYASSLSMGSMCTWLINARYPDMFAAMLITVGQGDYERVGILKDKPIWAWNAENDDKSGEGLAEIMNSFELAGAAVARDFVDASWPIEKLEQFVRDSLKKGVGIRHTQFAEGTLGEEWEHIGWKQVYANSALNHWLISHVNPHYSPREARQQILAVKSPVQLGLDMLVRQISANGRHTLILAEDGVYGFGSNCNGQLGRPREQLLATSGRPALLYAGTDVKKVAAGNNFSALLLNDGTVLTCGENAKGQLGNGGVKTTGLNRVEGLEHIVDVEAGTNYMIALGQDGTVWGWGDNSTGQLSNGKYFKSLTPMPLLEADGKTPIQDGAAIQAGMRTHFITRRDGTVWACGNGEYGQRGDGTEGHGPAPRKPGLVVTSAEGKPLTGIRRMGIGRCFSLALLESGEVWGWGWNIHGELGCGDRKFRLYPEKIPGLADIVDVSCGMNHTLALDRDGRVWTWGFNRIMGEGVLGQGDLENRDRPAVIPGLPPIKAVSAGISYSLLLDAQGRVWGFGNGNNNRLLLTEIQGETVDN